MRPSSSTPAGSAARQAGGKAAAALGLAALVAVSLAAGSPGVRAAESIPVDGSAAAHPSTQRLVLAYYYYWFQGDHRKQLPFRRVRNERGLSELTDHPWESVGPWMSFDRAQWHKNNFQMMAAGGVDVALAVYRGDEDNRRAYALTGLDIMTQGLKELRSEGLAPLMKVREYPQIGMALDLEGLADQYGEPVDLKDEDVQRKLYGMVRDFYLHIPEEFRATVQLPPGRIAAGDTLGVASTSQGSAYIVRLLGDSAVKDADDEFLRYVNRRFEKEFGARLVWVGTPELAKKVKGFDAVTPFPAAIQPATISPPELGAGEGWIHVASVGPGFDNTAASNGPDAGPIPPTAPTVPPTAPTIRPRENGAQTIVDFKRIISSDVDWTFVDSWNNFADGTDIAPTLEYGLLYRDLLRAAVLQYKQSADYAADILKASVPRVMSPGHIYQVEVVVQNSGTADWDPFNEAALSYRWVQKGKYVGDAGAPIPLNGLVRGDKKTVLIGVAPPFREKPLPNGNYELELGMTRHVGLDVVWFDQADRALFRVPVTVGRSQPARPFWVNSTLPAAIERGQAYPAIIRIRNDGSDTWKKGVYSLGYRWRKVSTYLKGASADADELVSEGYRVPIDADVSPGRLISVDIPVIGADASGKPLQTSSPKEDWVYVLEWDLFDGTSYLSAGGGATYREPVEVVERDPGVSFLGCNLQTELIAGQTAKVTVGLMNTGPQPWKKDRDKVVVHWYYMDGTEASWNDDALPLQEDVLASLVGETVRDDLAARLFRTPEGEKGEKPRKKGDKPPAHVEQVMVPTILRDVPVRVPYYFGPMYCEFDFQRDGLNASTAPASKGNDILVIPVNVYSPTFTPLTLASYFNVDGVSQDVARNNGDIDGRGNSIPAEFLPPYVGRPSVGTSPQPNPLYPSGLWVRPLNDLNNSRVCFLYPGKNDGTPDMVQCQGQAIEFGGLGRSAVHLLALSTEDEVTAEFTLMYGDGSSVKKAVQFTHWNEPPRHGERAAFIVQHRHTANGDDPNSKCYLNHYTLPADPQRQLVGIHLPRQPAVKILAITLEATGFQSK